MRPIETELLKSFKLSVAFDFWDMASYFSGSNSELSKKTIALCQERLNKLLKRLGIGSISTPIPDDFIRREYFVDLANDLRTVIDIAEERSDWLLSLDKLLAACNKRQWRGLRLNGLYRKIFDFDPDGYDYSEIKALSIEQQERLCIQIDRLLKRIEKGPIHKRFIKLVTYSRRRLLRQ